MSYDPNSDDSVLSRILVRLDTIDRKMDRIEDQTTQTNGRVSNLERMRDVFKAQVAAVSAAISAFVAALIWAMKQFL
jgi:ribosomal 50S subunit-associated protein YjgA (DUF615 family)